MFLVLLLACSVVAAQKEELLPLSQLPIYTTYTTNLHWLYTNLLDSLVAQGVPPSNVHRRVLHATPHSYKHGSPEFLAFCIARTEWVLATVRAHPRQILLFTDVDVQVFPGWFDALWPLVTEGRKNSLDIIFQSEFVKKKGNAGFYFTMGTPGAADFLETVRDNLAGKLKQGVMMHDQDMFYQVQREKRFRVATIPWALVNAGMGKQFHKRVVVHHAHMSGSYKFYNMKNMLKSKQAQYLHVPLVALHSGVCLVQDEKSRPACCVYANVTADYKACS